MKRGTDHTWKLIKYNGDVAIYARCSCKYHYCCSISGKDPSGNYNPAIQVPTIFHNYCPNCGARKKWHTDEIEKSNKYEFEDW